MRRKFARVLALSTVLLAGACSDVITSPSPRNSKPRFDTEPPPGEQWPARIREANATFSELTPGGYTTLTATMRYDGMEASIAANSMIRERTGAYITRTHPTRSTGGGFIGWNAYHRASYELIVQSRCGAIVEADVTFSALVSWVSLEAERYTMDQVTTGRSPSTRQLACEPCPAGTQPSGSEAEGGSDVCTEERDEPPSSGGGSTECPHCVEVPPSATYCRVRYHYWLDTGEIFSSTILWCA